MRQVLLLGCPQMHELMIQVAMKASTYKVGSVQWEEFENNFPNLHIDNIEAVAKSDVVFFASFDNPIEIFRQMAVIKALPRYRAKSLKVILPFFPTATDERVDEEGHVATAKSLERELSTIPLSSGGPAQIFFFDEHIKTLRFFFGDNVIPVPLSAMSLAIEKLKGVANASVCFPDSGSWKRFKRYFNDFPHIICDKVRGENEERIVTIKEGNPAGQFVLLIDDLTRTGATLEECRKVISAAGAVAVSAFVTHAVFKKDVARNFFYNPNCSDAKEGHFLNFWTTNSCPAAVEQVKGFWPFEVLSLADLIYEAIKE
jgi:phosphoribosylpyrophosphate synthetase